MTIEHIRFIGNPDFVSRGKFFWEIVLQLRNMGAGRYITKNEWLQKWPQEPSYLKVVKARPAMDRWMHGGKVWAEWTFRGQNLGIYEFGTDLNRSDWRLIHRHEEGQFLQNKNRMKEVTFPDSFPIPPLLTLLSEKEAMKSGKSAADVPKRAALDLAIDPQFAMLRPFIKQVAPTQTSASIYDEVDREAILDLYGDKLPVKVEAWTTGPAEFTPRFHIPKE